MDPLEQGLLHTGEWFAGEVVDPFSFRLSCAGSLVAVVFAVMSLDSFSTCLALVVLQTLLLNCKLIHGLVEGIIHYLCNFEFFFFVLFFLNSEKK